MSDGVDRPVRLLILDVNGVLYRYDRDHRIVAMAAAIGVDPDRVRRAVFDSGLEDASDSGDLAPDEYLHRASLEIGARLDRPTWSAALAEAVTVDQQALDLVLSVADEVQLSTLSNNGLLVAEEAGHVYPELAASAIEFHVAAELGASKPDRDVFVHLCELFEVAPAEAAFVDDKQKNVDGARRAGLRAHRMDGIDGLRRFLLDLGLHPT